ncbi:hypothetical protein [Acinetobacter sp. WCHAc060025]|uniref:hypothetical protein n=1 Tax=Acinetobacter sp. WCHAc060025 TaxID=2518625 RepID=UPI0013EEA7B5|nr:hypothetical protein [Acinetobacter sp. WCHAc060025]
MNNLDDVVFKFENLRTQLEIIGRLSQGIYKSELERITAEMAEQIKKLSESKA